MSLPRFISLCVLFIVPYLLVAALVVSAQDNDYHEAVLMDSVTSVTFRKGAYTQARRTRAIPQLEAVGGDARGRGGEPDVVQCTKTGWDGQTYQWRCEADLSEDYRFGPLEVNCEGWAYPQDPYITKGSCGLRYNLEFTEKGKQRLNRQSQNAWYKPARSSVSSWWDSLFGHSDSSYAEPYQSSSWWDSYSYPSSWLSTGLSSAWTIFTSLLILGPLIAVLVLGTCWSWIRSSSGFPGTHSYNTAPPASSGFWQGVATGGLLTWGYNKLFNRAPAPVYRDVRSRHAVKEEREPSPPRTRTATGYGGSSRR